MPDDTLDRLLASLILSPRDADLILVIADVLEGTGGDEPHPAVAWWRAEVLGLWGLADAITVRIRYRSDTGGTSLSAVSEPQYPGVADLCRRLEDAAKRLADEEGRRDRERAVSRVRRDYEENPALAQSVYCAVTPEDALRVMGVPRRGRHD